MQRRFLFAGPLAVLFLQIQIEDDNMFLYNYTLLHKQNAVVQNMLAVNLG